MRRINRHFEVILCCLLLSGCVLLPDEMGRPVITDGTTGTLSLAMTVSPSTVVIGNVSYTITGNSITPMTGTINAANSDVLTNSIDDIPAGNSYTISLTATSTDTSASTCTGSSTFNITADTVSSASVHLKCVLTKTTGSVLISGNFNICPKISSITCSTTTVNRNKTLTMSASASDPDSLPSPITYLWTQTNNIGSFSSTTSSSLTYTCGNTSGSTVVSLAVTDSDCSVSSTGVTITCN